MTRKNDARHGHDEAGHGRGGHGSFEPEEGGRQVPYSHEQPLACPIGDEKGKTHFFDDPERVKWVLRILYTICGGLFLVDFVFHRHAVHPWEHWWGFYPIYGFVSCVLLVLAAKEMRKVLMRDEDYYGGTGRQRGTGGDAHGHPKHEHGAE